jgi:putative oxidoreductase
MLPRTLPGPAGDIVILIGRVLLGVVLIAHGWQKLFDSGISGTARQFAGVGIPLPTVAAVFAATVEVLGGALLLLGAFTAVVGVLVVLDMLGAAVFVHIPKGEGIFVKTNGWELVGVIAAGALILAGFGAGRFSVDGFLAVRRSGVVHHGKAQM